MNELPSSLAIMTLPGSSIESIIPLMKNCETQLVVHRSIRHTQTHQPATSAFIHCLKSSNLSFAEIICKRAELLDGINLDVEKVKEARTSAVFLRRCACTSLTFAVIQFAIVPEKAEMPEITIKVLSADVVINAHDAALYERA